MSLEDDQSLAVEMSKSKRKRMKQKKSKQRKEEEEVKRVSTPQIPQLDSLNPIDKMRGDLLNLGYDFDVVNAAMDKMWNLEMDYSDFNSVLNFIQGEELLLSTISANSSTTSRNQDIGNDDANGDNSNGSGNHGKDIIIAVGTNGANGNHGRHDDDSIDPVNDNTTAATTATASGANTVVSKEYSVYSNSSQQKDLVEQEQPPVVLADNAVRIKKIRPKKFDLSEKLDFVANSENLNDGIIALTEWVTKAASPAEIQELCSSTTTNALKTIIRRSIQPENRNSTGQLLDLVGSILRTIRSPSSQLIATVKALGSLLRKASIAISTNANTTTLEIQKAIADKVVDNAVYQLSSVVNSLIHTGNSSKIVAKKVEGEIEQMEIELAASSSKTTTASVNILELMTKRDKTKAIVYKYTNLIHISLKGKNAMVAADAHAGSHTQNSVIHPNDVMKQMLGREYDSVVSSKKKLEQLRSGEQQKSSVFVDRDQQVSTIHALKTDKELVQCRMEQLRAELQQLLREEMVLEESLEVEQSKLESLEGSLGHELRQVSGQLDIVSNNAKVEAYVSAVAKDICEYANAMDVVSGAHSGAATDSGAALAVPNTLGSLLTATSRYFASELKTVEYLKKRSAKIQADIPTLQREIVEFAALGMATTVSDMKKMEKEMQDNVTDDNELVEGLAGEADATKNACVEQLQGFLVSPAFDQTKQESYATALKEIDRILSDLGVNGDKRWSSIMVMYGVEKRPDDAEKKTINVKPKEKKHGWNLAVAMNGSDQTKSLLDIQHEQM